jgi:hypothetical protein
MGVAQGGELSQGIRRAVHFPISGGEFSAHVFYPFLLRGKLAKRGA